MQDAINLLMLICASLAALAFGVLAAYGICSGAFFLFRLHARSISAETETAQVKLRAESQIPHAS
jgi:hypothetical protein